MFADTRETETVFGPVIQAGLEALKVNAFRVLSCFVSRSRILRDFLKMNIKVNFQTLKTVKMSIFSHLVLGTKLLMLGLMLLM